MHRIQLGEILRDAEVANAISTIVHQYRLSEDQTERALSELHVARAANVALITHQTFPLPRLLCNYRGKLWSELAGFGGEIEADRDHLVEQQRSNSQS
jgi:hypothetical protein